MAVQKVLVAFDTSAEAVGAARWAQAVAGVVGAQFVAASVPEDLGARFGTDATEAARREHLDQLLAAWSAEIGGAEPDLRLGSGSVSPALNRIALDVGADLMVLGSARATGSLAKWMTSTAARVAHRTPLPLVVVPAGWLGVDVGRIVVGLDGSEPSEVAKEWAVDLAVATGAVLDLAHVDYASVEMAPPEDPQNWRHRARDRLGRWVAPVVSAHPDLTVESEAIWDPDPAEGLLARAGSTGADLVVVGAHGLGGITGARLGGTAMAVLHRSDRPVALIPPPA